MILPQLNQAPVMTNITGASEKMSLVMSGKAFQILSSSLYSHKIRAILRELGTNAWDSHQESGRSHLPFDLQLPTVFNPIFRIRDYGTGMDEDTIFQVYNVLFASTKTTSNEAVGCLGLGSKSPFSYTSSITVISYQAGVQKIYNSLMDSDGIPTMIKVLECETTEADGLEIQFAVNECDFYEFITESKYVFSTFLQGSKPNFLNCDISADELTAPFTRVADNIYLAPRYSVPHSGDVYVIQGNVAYPIASRMLSLETRNALSHLSGVKTVFVIVPIGSVDFQPSREALTESKENYAKIESFVSDIEKHLLEQARKDYSHLNTLYDFCEFESKYYADVREVDDIYIDYYVRKVAEEKGINPGDITRKWTTSDIGEALDKLDVDIVGSRRGTLIYHRTVSNPTHGPAQLVLNKSGLNTFIEPEPHVTRHLTYPDIHRAQKLCVIVEVDEPKKAASRIKAHFQGTGLCRIVLKNSLAHPHLVETIKRELPGFKVIKTSEMDVPVTASRAASRPRVMRRWFNIIGCPLHRENLKTLKDLGIDESKPLFYIEGNRYGVAYRFQRRYQCPSSWVQTLKKYNVIPKDASVVFVRDMHVDKMPKHYPLATSLYDHIDKWVTDNLSKKEIQHLANTSYLNRGDKLELLQSLSTLLTSKEYDFYEEVHSVISSNKSRNMVDDFRDFFDLCPKFSITPEQPVANTLWNKFKAAYPLVAETITSDVRGYRHHLNKYSQELKKILKRN